jgi:flagellar motor switch/type III secretory pathway protein FliN
MANFTPEIAPQVLAAAEAGAAEAAGALSRALDSKLEFKVGETGNWDPNASASSLTGPGLAIVLNVDGANSALVLIAESTGLLPNWYADPDPTGTSKLATLAQELGMLLLPEDLMPSDFAAGHVPNLAEAISRGGIQTGAGQLAIELTGEGMSGPMLMLWPAPHGDAVLRSATDTAKPTAAPLGTSKSTAGDDAEEPDFESLPLHMRSLLRVKVAISVSLASKKSPVKDIVEMVPGAIIQFSKPCDEMLDVEARGLRLAQGECVKVGDKFGIRITSIVLPAERFRKVG